MLSIGRKKVMNVMRRKVGEVGSKNSLV